MSNRKSPGLDALKNAGANIQGEVVQETAPVEAVVAAAPDKSKGKNKAFPLHLPVEVHEALRELSFHERKSMSVLLREGVDFVFKNRGMPTIEELQKKA